MPIVAPDPDVGRNMPVVAPKADIDFKIVIRDPSTPGAGQPDRNSKP